jgi:hypothetical protein
MKQLEEIFRSRILGMLRPGDNPPEKEDSVDFTILDVSDYESPRAASKTWRELIKKVWEVDPLTCPRCGSDLSATCPPSASPSGVAGGSRGAQARRAGMKIISLIQDPDIIRQILKHLGLWKQDVGSRCKKPTKPEHRPVAYEDFDDPSACGRAQAGGWPGYEDTAVTLR